MNKTTEIATLKAIAEATNPAKKLLIILTRLREVDTEQGKTYGGRNVSAQATFKNALNIENTPLLLLSIAKISALPSAIRYHMTKIDNINHQLYLQWMPKLQLGFTTLRLDDTIYSFLVNTNDNTFYGLAMCSDILDRTMLDKVFKYEEMVNIREEAEKLNEQIVLSNVSPDLKDYMSGNVSNLRDATHEWIFDGSKAIKSAFEKTIGSAVIEPNINSRIKETEYGEKFWKLISKIKLIMDVVVGPLKISESITKLLT